VSVPNPILILMECKVMNLVLRIKRNSFKLTIFGSMVVAIVNCGGTSNISEDSNAEDGTDQSSSLAISFSTTPTAESHQAFAHFEFSAPDANSYLCEINQHGYLPCESPVTLMPLSIGTQTFAVKALDITGAEGIEATYQWNIVSVIEPIGETNHHTDLIETSVQPDPVAANSWRGIFRINCDFSHSSYNDPIVYPLQQNAAHLHRFYGNTLVDHTTTEQSLFTLGESSCQGNLLNLSSYWVPALLAPSYDPVSGERLDDNNGDPAWKVVPAVVGDNDEAHEIFYYSAGINDLDSIQPIPVGLRMIAGSHMGQPGQQQDTSIVRWHCQSWGSDDAENPRFSPSIPACVAPDRVRMDIFFPSCWDGVNLDSTDHKSHMAYPVASGSQNGAACPESHPVPIVRPSYHYAFGVKPEVYEPSTMSSANWKLASDMYQADDTNFGGMSLHADWFNAWHPEVMQMILNHCIQQELDCHDGNLANGFRLSGTRPGSQQEPEIINGGLGG
jgi:hypothetical protein